MKKYTIFWLNAEAQLIEGNDLTEAFNKAGIGRGSLKAMDFYVDGDQRNKYKWNKALKYWEPMPIEPKK